MSILVKDASFIDLPLLVRGKVRDVFDLGDSLLMVVTDRISAFDVVFNELIPDKGVVLNSISAFWFNLTRDIMPNHIISTDPAEYPLGLSRHASLLAGRSMWVRKVDMLPVECIVRGYLEGSALKEYRQCGSISGIGLPPDLRQADRLPEPIFTPSTKEQSGHDINITYRETCELIGSELAVTLREKCLALYNFAANFAEKRGIILADTKLEFGLVDGKLVVADEMFTPDSSRFWDKADYWPGRAQKSFDKQFLREWLESSDWDKSPPPPALPDEIISRTAEKYRDAYSRLTGRTLPL
jgi:phosphoribosylaminoimidazole-succinocarboxamide synthase